MALFKCSECGGQVSDKAVACPHCGCPVVDSCLIVEDTHSEEVAVHTRDKSDIKETQHQGKRGLIVGIVVLSIIAICVIIYNLIPLHGDDKAAYDLILLNARSPYSYFGDAIEFELISGYIPKHSKDNAVSLYVKMKCVTDYGTTTGYYKISGTTVDDVLFERENYTTPDELRTWELAKQRCESTGLDCDAISEELNRYILQNKR